MEWNGMEWNVQFETKYNLNRLAAARPVARLQVTGHQADFWPCPNRQVLQRLQQV